MTTQSSDRAASPRLTLAMLLLRALCHLVVVIALAYWAFSDWQLPWPGLATGIGITLLAVVIWAVFLSPRPMLQVDRFGLGLVELLFIGSGVAAMLSFGMPWIIAALFGLVAAILGYVAPERLR